MQPTMTKGLFAVLFDDSTETISFYFFIVDFFSFFFSKAKDIWA